MTDSAVLIREILGTDTAALIDMHARLSGRTVYQRFFHAMPQLAVAQAERFTHVDGLLRYALVAEDETGQLVAVGRYDRFVANPAQAEVAVVVRDDFQHRGIGTLLLQQLTEHAREQGVLEFVADVLVGNRGMRHTFTDAGLHARTVSYDGGVDHLVMSLS